MIDVQIKEQANRLSDLKNPFMADKVIQFTTFCMKSSFSGEWSYTGKIEFQNGDTKGEQKFSGEDLAALLRKMELFMAELGAET